MLVSKKIGRLRLCVSYRIVNAAKIAASCPLPRMDDCLDSLGDSSEFSTFEAMAGYWKITVREEDLDKTTFTAHVVTFRNRRMPFVLRNASATFQRALYIILSGVRCQSCLVFLEDIIVLVRVRRITWRISTRILVCLDER